MVSLKLMRTSGNAKAETGCVTLTCLKESVDLRINREKKYAQW